MLSSNLKVHAYSYYETNIVIQDKVRSKASGPVCDQLYNNYFMKSYTKTISLHNSTAQIEFTFSPDTIPSNTAIIIIAVDPLDENCIPSLDQSLDTIPTDFNGLLIVCTRNGRWALCGTYDKIKIQQEKLQQREHNIDAIIDGIRIHCASIDKHTILFESDINKMIEFMDSRIQNLSSDNSKLQTLFEKRFSKSFDINQITPEKFIAAINIAKENYGPSYIPSFFSNLYLEKRLPINLDTTKTNTTTALKLLDILQGTGGTDMKSFKYQLISNLFNLFVNSDEEADEAISQVITSIKLTTEMNHWEKIKPFLLWNQQNNVIPRDITNHVVQDFLCTPLVNK